MSDSDLDLILYRFPTSQAVRTLNHQILNFIRSHLSESELLKYAILLDLNEINFQSEFDGNIKDNVYGAFMDLVRKELGAREGYDNDLLFLLWGLMTRKRWMEPDQIHDWLMEVVEPYFEDKGWDIERLYSETHSILKTIKQAG
ncbi:hypothetical protein [Phyllobacterium sp. 22552]|uniref:hypothetical protein n=1 Tax=Phyllobacterium sp. 22552 TaxID=3453941 RepID=UPI003F83C131